MLKKLLGIAPKPDQKNSFCPSSVAMKLVVDSKTDYDHTTYPNPYKGNQKVLMVCTEARFMTMRNGKKFSTGNHPVEMMVPMLHLTQAGFDIDIATPTGKPVKIEMWAMPKDDETVQNYYKEHESSFQNPLNLSDLVPYLLQGDSEYIAVFIPGGHGAMLGLPEDENVKQAIHWAANEDKYMLAICHGPAALLAANLGEDENTFVYKGYEMAVFPDSLDKITPLFGYMPGRMPWNFGEKLEALGVEIINKNANGTCHQDRKLITGDGPKAANEFGKLAAEALLKELKSTTS